MQIAHSIGLDEGVANFSDSFEPYLPPSQERTRIALKTGIVVADANVLLDAYRYTTDARTELFASLRALGDRLWIPHQVALEFHRNRTSVIASHGEAYRDAVKAISDFRKQFNEQLVRQVRQFVNRVALDDQTQRELVSTAEAALDEEALEALTSRIGTLEGLHGVSNEFFRDDPVLSELQKLLAGRVGERLSADEEAEARAEAQRRVDAGLPPGFKDARKEDPCGDYLLWYESLKEAKRRNVPLVLVTRDGKDDWFLNIKGQTIAALPALVQEAFNVSGVDFVALPTRSFLLHARSEFKTTVSQATLAQSEAIQKHRPRSHSTSYRFSPSELSRFLELVEQRLATLEEERSTLTVDLDANESSRNDSQSPPAVIERHALLQKRIHTVSAEHAFVSELRRAVAHPAKLHDDGTAEVRLSTESRRYVDILEKRFNFASANRDAYQPSDGDRSQNVLKRYRAGGAAALLGMSLRELMELGNHLGISFPADQPLTRAVLTRCILSFEKTEPHDSPVVG